jgi:hypothetical protein
MAKIKYLRRFFHAKSMRMIKLANEIIEEYLAEDFELTLRQLYYQFVARDLIENKESEYERLGQIVNGGRLAGLIDWEAIVDRTRNLQENSSWDSPASILRSAAYNYQIDLWLDQKIRCEFWIEKDALIGVIADPCSENDVPYFSCRGYVSQSEMWRAGQRLERWLDLDYEVIVFHLGDHDPSGVDMSRDIQDRLDLFTGQDRIKVQRIALTMEQINQYNPPPNPAKITDSRCADYIRRFGNQSWELDALEPRVLRELVLASIKEIRDNRRYKARIRKQEREREQIQKIADNWRNYVGKN